MGCYNLFSISIWASLAFCMFSWVTSIISLVVLGIIRSFFVPKTIWGKLCGPYGVCSLREVAQYSVRVLTLGDLYCAEDVSTWCSLDICTLRNLYFVGAALCMRHVHDIHECNPSRVVC